MLASLLDLALYLAGAALFGGLVCRWQPQVPVRVAGLYTLLALGFVGPALLGPGHQVATDIAYAWTPLRGAVEERVRPANPLLSDPLLHMLPYRTLVRDRLLAGRPPLWANELGTGMPLAGNAQSAPLSPLNLLTLPLPPLRGATVTAAWQLLLGLLFTHALLLRLAASPQAAAFAAIAFTFSTFSVAWLYYPLGLAPLFLPGLLVGVLALRDDTPHALPGLALVAFGMATAGHPESLLHATLVVGLQCLWLLSRAPRRLELLGRLAAAGALAFALAAPAVLPILEAVPESLRFALVQRAAPTIDSAPFEPRMLPLLVNPLSLGSPRDGNWHGPSNFNETATLYAGALTLALGLVGASRRRGQLALVAGLLALAVALRLPPVFQWVDSLPGLEHSVHGRLRIVWLLLLAIAAGLGLDRLREPGGRWLGVVASLAVLLALLALPPAEVAAQQLWWAATALGLGAFVMTLAVARWSAAGAWVALAALALDLGTLGLRYNPTVRAELDLRPPPIVARLQSEAFTGPAPLRVIARDYDLFPHLGALYGLWDPRGSDPMMPAAAALFRSQALRPPFQLQARSQKPAVTASDDWLPFLRVGFLLTPRREEVPSPWELAAQGNGTRLWRHPAPLPLFFRPRALVGTEPTLLLRQALREPSPQDRLVVDAQALARHHLDGPAARDVQARAAAVEVAAVTPNGFTLRSAGGGLIASSVSHASGWRAVGAGRRLPVLRAHAAFLGVLAPAPPAVLELRYLPASWVLGCGLAALGLTALLALTLARPRGSTLSATAE